MKKIRTDIKVKTKVGKKYTHKEIIIPVPSIVELIKQGYVPKNKVLFRVRYWNYIMKKGKLKCSIDIRKNGIMLDLVKPKSKLEYFLIKGGKENIL